MSASELPVRRSAVLVDLKTELSSNGFDGLRCRIQQLGGMQNLPLRAAFSLPPDPHCLDLLSAMAVRIETAIDQDKLSIFQAGMDCYTKVFNFICQGKPDLWLGGRASSSDIAHIRSMYILVLRRSPISLWPTYLFIFGFAYSSGLPLWISWLQEETKISADTQEIQQVFLQHLSPCEGQVCGESGYASKDLLHDRKAFITRALAEDFIRQLGVDIGPSAAGLSTLPKSPNKPKAISTKVEQWSHRQYQPQPSHALRCLALWSLVVKVGNKVFNKASG